MNSPFLNAAPLEDEMQRRAAEEFQAATRVSQLPAHRPTLATQVGGDHYARMAIQPAEFIHKNRMGFIEGSIIKYVSRHRAKNGKQDLEKARHFLDMLIEMEYPEKTGGE